MDNTVLKLSSDRPMSSLRDLCLMKVSTAIWNNEELLSSIMKCHLEESMCYRSCTRHGEEWAAIQATAKNLISSLCICDTLMESIKELLWPATFRILTWMFKYAPCIDNKILQKFYWTDRGRVDNVRTARYIIGNKETSIRRRFVLACVMCLSIDIYEIWEEMSEECKLYFRRANHEGTYALIRFWLHILEGSEGVLEQYMMDAIECATLLGLPEAVKYLFSFLIGNVKSDMALLCLDQLKVKVLDENFLEDDEVEIGFFLLSQMSIESQQTVYSSHFELIFSLLLNTSGRENDLNVLVERIESFCQYEALCIESLLRILFYMYHLEVSKDYSYRKLFINVWRTISDSVKCFLATQTDLGVFCLGLLVRDNFPFLLREGEFLKFTELTSPDFKPSTSLEQYDFNQDRWDFLIFLIKEEVAVNPCLVKYMDSCFTLLRISRSLETCFENLSLLICKIRNTN